MLCVQKQDHEGFFYKPLVKLFSPLRLRHAFVARARLWLVPAVTPLRPRASRPSLSCGRKQHGDSWKSEYISHKMRYAHFKMHDYHFNCDFISCITVVCSVKKETFCQRTCTRSRRLNEQVERITVSLTLLNRDLWSVSRHWSAACCCNAWPHRYSE